MRNEQHLIFHNGRYYVGTVADFMHCCNLNPSWNPTLSRATPDEAELYVMRRGGTVQEARKARQIVTQHLYLDGK